MAARFSDLPTERMEAAMWIVSFNRMSTKVALGAVVKRTPPRALKIPLASFLRNVLLRLCVW